MVEKWKNRKSQVLKIPHSRVIQNGLWVNVHFLCILPSYHYYKSNDKDLSYFGLLPHLRSPSMHPVLYLAFMDSKDPAILNYTETDFSISPHKMLSLSLFYSCLLCRCTLVGPYLAVLFGGICGLWQSFPGAPSTANLPFISSGHLCEIRSAGFLHARQHL